PTPSVSHFFTTRLHHYPPLFLSSVWDASFYRHAPGGKRNGTEWNLNGTRTGNPVWGGRYTGNGNDTPGVGRTPPLSEKTGGEWMWARDSSPSSGLMRVLSAVAFKSQVVVRSLMAFVLMSTVTALTVRTLLSSGVVIMFPMVMLLERMGLQGVDLQQMLALSYPWLGLPIEHLRNRNKPVGPFIMGHIMQMVVFYTVYNACLLAWSYWLYGKTMTTSLQVCGFTAW
ncbi:unnamed protein product, partial [Ectocarpus fasciculatus]